MQNFKRQFNKTTKTSPTPGLNVPRLDQIRTVIDVDPNGYT